MARLTNWEADGVTQLSIWSTENTPVQLTVVKSRIEVDTFAVFDVPQYVALDQKFRYGSRDKEYSRITNLQGAQTYVSENPYAQPIVTCQVGESKSIA